MISRSDLTKYPDCEDSKRGASDENHSTQGSLDHGAVGALVGLVLLAGLAAIVIGAAADATGASPSCDPKPRPLAACKPLPLKPVSYPPGKPLPVHKPGPHADPRRAGNGLFVAILVGLLVLVCAALFLVTSRRENWRREATTSGSADAPAPPAAARKVDPPRKGVRQGGRR